MTTIDDIIENFALLDDWDDRYRYVIELGRTLVPLPDTMRTDVNKVQGCASQVWLGTSVKQDGEAGPLLTFVGDSDGVQQAVLGLFERAIADIDLRSHEGVHHLGVDHRAAPGHLMDGVGELVQVGDALFE